MLDEYDKAGLIAMFFNFKFFRLQYLYLPCIGGISWFL